MSKKLKRKKSRVEGNVAGMSRIRLLEQECLELLPER